MEISLVDSKGSFTQNYVGNEYVSEFHPDCQVLSLGESDIESMQVGWDYMGISSLKFWVNDGREVEFGERHAAVNRFWFTDERKFVGFEGSVGDEDGILKTLGALVYDKDRCDDPLEEIEEPVDDGKD